MLAAPATRRDRERLARRRAMLDAALAVFGEHGFDGATVDEIAERAEFGKGTLYNYFPGGKDELYLALFDEHVLGGLAAVIERAVPADADLATPAGAREAFRRLIAGLFAHFEANRSVTLVFMREGHRMMTDPTIRVHVAGRFERLMDAVARLVERGVASGALRRLPPHAVAHLLMGTVRGMLMARLAGGPDGAEPTGGDPADFLTTVLFDGLLADRV